MADLAIVPTEGETTINYSLRAFQIKHVVETVPEDDKALRDQLVEALRTLPLQVTPDSQSDAWSVAAWPNATNEPAGIPWNVLFQSQDRFLTTIGVRSDVSAWGIDTFDELHALSREEFDRIMAERQTEAIDVLKPLSDALQAVVSP